MGYASVRLDHDALFISKLYVKIAYRRRQVGKQLLAEIYEYAQAQKKSKIRLLVNKKNKDSIAVYLAWGFTVTDAIVTDIGNGFCMDDYIMERVWE